MTKSEARKEFREKRVALSNASIEKLNDLVLLQFQKIELPFLNCVHSYIASEKLREADTSLILRYLQFINPDLKIAAPKIDVTSLRMTHYHITSYDQLKTNIYGIEEPHAGTVILPADIDLVLIPLLAFDRMGNRVGYGKGYYDRFLADCRRDVIKIGLSFFDPVDQIEDADEYDVKMNFCVTTHTVYDWTKQK